MKNAKGRLSLYYDEQGDFLEISVIGYGEGYFKNMGRGIFKRIDKKTKKVTGLAVMGFKKRTKLVGKREISAAINGLLLNELIKHGRKSLFGVDKGLKPFVREHKDRF